MRQIEFRGLRADGQGWMKGSLVGIYDPHQEQDVVIETYIHEGTRISPLIEVIPSTVGQFTGLLDDDGMALYDGDRVHTAYGDLTIEWNDDTCKFQYAENGMDINDNQTYGMHKVLIGNIHEQ